MARAPSRNQATLDRISELVQKHYEASDRPFLLAELGSHLVAEFGPLRDNLGGMSLAEAIAGIPEMALVRHSDIPQRIAVATVVNKTRIQDGLEKRTPPVATMSFDPKRLQRAIVYAFQQDPGEEEEVYISARPPLRFQVIRKLTDPDEHNLLLIPKDLISPNNPPERLENLSPEKRITIVSNMKTWLKDINIPLQNFYFYGTSGDAGNLLLRLIDAQPPDIRARLLIPADVILKLSSNN